MYVCIVLMLIAILLVFFTTCSCNVQTLILLSFIFSAIFNVLIQYYLYLYLVLIVTAIAENSHCLTNSKNLVNPIFTRLENRVQITHSRTEKTFVN